MRKILIAYATRGGSTAEVAEVVAEVLGATGASVDVAPVKNVQDLSGYDAVVIGSAIRMGQWLPEAVDFVQTNRVNLSHIPTAYFVVSAFLRNDTPTMRQEVRSYLDPVCQLLEPVSIGLFAGKMDYRRLSCVDRMLAKVMKQREGDWRNWEAIESWARALEPLLIHTNLAIV